MEQVEAYNMQSECTRFKSRLDVQIIWCY